MDKYLPGDHIVTVGMKQRVRDLAIAGIPKYLIAKVLKICPQTLVKYYQHELDCAQPEAIERIAKTVAMQAEAGDAKAQALYLKTQGAKFGWVEKQVIENQNADEAQALKERIQELEGKFEKDY